MVLSLRASTTADRGWKWRIRLNEWMVLIGTGRFSWPSTFVNRNLSVSRLESEK